jgi:integrase
MKSHKISDERYQKLIALEEKEEKKNRPKRTGPRYPVLKLEKDPENLHMYVNDVRILTVADYKKLKSAIPKEHHQNLLDVLLITGMRYEEILRLHCHKDWYNAMRNIIHLPEEAQQKKKRKQKERTINPLPGAFDAKMKAFFNGPKPPNQNTWDVDMRRWAEKAGIKPYGIGVKTTRKTIECWLINTGHEIPYVCQRQGHDMLTSVNHYQKWAFSRSEIADIEDYLKSNGMMY